MILTIIDSNHTYINNYYGDYGFIFIQGGDINFINSAVINCETDDSFLKPTNANVNWIDSYIDPRINIVNLDIFTNSLDSIPVHISPYYNNHKRKMDIRKLFTISCKFERPLLSPNIFIMH